MTLTNKSSFHLYILSNSPGEIATWCQPICQQFKALYSSSVIHVFLTPCSYASGHEASFLQNNAFVNHVFTPKQTLQSFFLKGPWFSKPCSSGAVLFLGGDPFYAQFLGVKYRLPVFAYTNHKQKLGPFFKKIFYQHLDGDLMMDHVFFQESKVEKPKVPLTRSLCSFFTGSRPEHTKAFYPIIISIIHYLKQLDPHFPAAIHFSPFTPKALSNELVQANPSPVPVYHDQGHIFLKQSRLLVTLPGSNTTHAMYLQCPMFVLVPLNRPDLIILDGLLHYVTKLPLLGPFIKDLLLKHMIKNTDYFSLPNRHFKKAVLPELVAVIDPKKTAQMIYDLYHNEDKLTKMSDTFASLKLTDALSKQICTTVFSSSYKT